ncbi:MAG TPA: ribonuclease HII [Candidatus Saccharimonadales bacterium]|nr:ribonuclease HII [Candidatus Saccharimonadales bacterium]
MGYILGIDEVGRGAWAGPLVLGAVILGESRIRGLKDSKLLPPEARRKLSERIYKRCVFASLGWVTSNELDEIGLTAATTLGIRRALSGFDFRGSEMIIDGSINYFKEYDGARCIIKADRSVPAVSAAGIIAKVARDDYMKKLAVKFPAYGFDSHVGYGTKVHRLNIEKHGACPEHRSSFKPLAVYV